RRTTKPKPIFWRTHRKSYEGWGTKMNVITLTLNPAFDIHCGAERFTAEKENVAVVLSKDVNIHSLLDYFMGKNTNERTQFVMDNLREEIDQV
ncbi:MAG: hypothetical protein MJZ46_02455, partial [Bacteroidales bacterium]|nr:hypothetical protein [Bacteroidales bacterium]